MAEYMSKEAFLSSMGLAGDETKYGNRDAEHQHRSYSAYMSYEIMDSVDDSIVEEELAPVRHGRWIESQRLYYGAKQYECSLCWAEEFWDKHGITEKYPCCPNCGAIMEAPNA